MVLLLFDSPEYIRAVCGTQNIQRILSEMHRVAIDNVTESFLRYFPISSCNLRLPKQILIIFAF